jgi:hypothetical protein
MTGNEPARMPRLELPRIVFFGRTTEEYAGMWNISITELAGRTILDCPCGPANFIAGCREAGVQATGIDPMLALPVDEIERRGVDDIVDTMAAIAASDAGLASEDPAAWERDKRRALAAFLEDLRRHGPDGADPDGSYIPGALPDLPFEDRSFDLVLSGHLLFSYASVEHGGLVEARASLDLDFHLTAVDELARVARHEVRLFPAVTMTSEAGGPHPWAAPVRDRLENLGFGVRTEDVEYDEGVSRNDALMVATRS